MSRQRIRDPIHDLIVFDDSPFETAMWNAVMTRPFQRLRRVRQLGFSEFVYPGATHTRFAHSLGVFHTAKQLMAVIERELGNKFSTEPSQRALAAALLHDLGHGPFSHAFETVKKRLGFKKAKHEFTSEDLIRSDEIASVFPKNNFGSGFADDVAEVLRNPNDIYSAVVSSQFDADRLDYLRRDPFMAGSRHAQIDFNWLIDNLEVGSVPNGSDNAQGEDVQTLVLNGKAVFAAEAYVLGVFQLYPTIYFHKATRAAEAMFTEMLFRVMTAARESNLKSIGLTSAHPLVRYAKDPENLEAFLELDDTVIWGSLHALANCKEPFVSEAATRLQKRDLFKAYDIRNELISEARRRFPTSTSALVASKPRKGSSEDVETEPLDDPKVRREREKFIARVETRVLEAYEDQCENDSSISGRILLDRAERPVYKTLSVSKQEQEQIHVRLGKKEDGLADIVEISPTIRATPKFEFFRLYTRTKSGKDRNLAVELLKNALKKEG